MIALLAALALAGCDRVYVLPGAPADGSGAIDAAIALDAGTPIDAPIATDARPPPIDAGPFDPSLVIDTLGVRVRFTGPEPRSEPGSPEPLFCDAMGAMHPATWAVTGRHVMQLCPALHATMGMEPDRTQCRPIACAEDIHCFHGMLPCIEGMCMAPFNEADAYDVRAYCMRDRPRPTHCGEHREHVRELERLTDGPVARQCSGEFGPCTDPPWDCSP